MRCSNYPFRHAKTLHCEESKTFASGTWTRCFFIKLLIILFLMYYHFQTLVKFHCQLFLFRVKMVNQCDKPVNLRKFVFDVENHEQKSRKLFGSTCNRSLLVFCDNFLL